MKFIQRALAAALAVSLIVSSSPAEAWMNAPALRPIPKPISTVQSQALSAPADVFGNEANTAAAAETVFHSANRQRTAAFATNSQKGLTRLGMLMVLNCAALALGWIFYGHDFVSRIPAVYQSLPDWIPGNKASGNFEVYPLFLTAIIGAKHL